LEAPAGLVGVKAQCEKGKVKRVYIENVPSFVDKQNVPLEVEGIGTVTVDTAYGGDSFVIVDAQSLGFTLNVDEGREIVETGIRITNAANEQLDFKRKRETCGPSPDISFCQLTNPVKIKNDIATGKNTVVIQPGKLDRSPTGTGCSARMALLYQQGKLKIGDRFIGESIINTEFHCQIKQTARVGNKSAIVPVISGRTWITGTYQHRISEDDPFPLGYRISDTWPMIK